MGSVVSMIGCSTMHARMLQGCAGSFGSLEEGCCLWRAAQGRSTAQLMCCAIQRAAAAPNAGSQLLTETLHMACKLSQARAVFQLHLA